jgi:hypothetical protein
MPPRLPPTFLRTTLFTNEVFGNVFVQGNIRSGSITANVIYGNVSGVNIVAQNIYGNLTSNNWTPGNVTNLNITGNMTAGYFIGNGSQLTDIAAYTLPSAINVDITGNQTGVYSNVTTLIGTTGDVGNVRMVGGNVEVSGQINTLGNVVAPFFVGNGSQLTGIAQYILPGSANIDISGNVTGNYANVMNIIATSGNIGNVIITGGNVSGSNISGQSIFANLITFGVNANVGKMTGLYCVATNGNDSTADGSDVKPFLTIQAAHDRAWTEYPPSASGAIDKQVEIRVAPGTYGSPITITRYNTIIRGAGSLFGRGQYTAIGQVTVNCANAAYIFNNTVGLDRVLCLNGVTNTGNGAYTLNIDSCYLTANTATPLTSENDKSYVYVNDTFLSASLAGGNTYIRATGNLLNFYDCTIQAPAGIASGGQFIDVGGNCAITFERCSVNPTTSTNAIIKATSSVPSGVSGFKINITNSYLQNLGGPGVDFGTTNTAGSFIRNTTAVSPSSNVFVGNGTAYENGLIVLPGTSNSRVSTVTVVPYATFSNYALPGNASIDIRGNVIGSYANVTTLIGTTGNVGNVRMVGGNVAVSGQVNALGNIIAPFFVGNGSQLTGVTSTLPGSANIDIRGNVIGGYANVTTLLGTTGNVGNVIMMGGNVALGGQVNALGNVVAPFFIGNGSLLTGLTTSARYLSAGRTTNQTSAGTWANVNIILDTVRASSGIAYNTSTGVFTLEGGVTYRITAQLNWNSAAVYEFTYRLVNSTTGAQIGPAAEGLSMASGSFNSSGPVLDIILTPSVTTDYRLRMATSTTANAGETLRADTGTFLTIVGLGSGFTSGLPSTGNIDISGNVIGAYANVTTLIGATGNVGNVRMVGGNVAVSGQVNVLGNVVSSFFMGNGSLLSGIAAALPGIIAEDIRGNVIGAYANVDTILSNTATITSAGNANVLTVAGTTTNTTGSLIQGTSLRGNNSTYSMLRLDNIGGRLLDINGNGEMSLTSATTNDIMTISTRTGALAGNALAIVVPRLSFTEYSFIDCRNLNGTLFSVDGRGMLTSQCAVNGNVVNVVSTSATNTNDMIRIQSSASAAQPFNMISAKNAAGNVFRVTGAGAVFGVGAYNTSGADYAEMFEWEDGNINDEDRRGMTVIKGNNGVIRIATGIDNPIAIFGVVSTNPSIVGDAKWGEWNGRYLRDRFGSKLSNTVYYIANVSNENERVRCAPTATPSEGYEKIVSSEFVENPEYDPNVAYISREDRKEWATIGLVGKLMVLPGQAVNPNWILFRNIPHPDGDVLEYIVK